MPEEYMTETDKSAEGKDLERLACKLEDCRICRHYHFNRDIEVESFDCDADHFHRVEYGGLRPDEGADNWFGCQGRDFSLDQSSMRWQLYEEEIKEKLRKEKYKSLIMGEIDESCHKIIMHSLEDSVRWFLKPSEARDLRNADAIAAFSFGYGPAKTDGKTDGKTDYHSNDFHPGKSNEAIAALINKFASTSQRANIFAQWEIADSLKRYGLSLDNAHTAKPVPGKYLGTRGVADNFFDHGLNEYEKIVVFAHPMHLYRCVKTLEKTAKDRKHECSILVPDCSAVPFGEQSVQDWTRDIKSWVLHEISSRAYARSQGHM